MQPRLHLLAAPGLALLAPLAASQGLPRIYVTDAGNDQVQRLDDLNADGDYDDAGEVSVFYDDTLGSQALSNNNGIAVDADGVVYVCDASFDLVLALEDLDGDGVCHSAGEARIWYSDANQEGIPFPAAGDMTFDGKRLWIAVAGSSSDPTDLVMWAEDLDGDGNALGAGESGIYYLPAAGSSSGGDSVPQDVQVGRDGRVYYLDVPSSGSLAKGIYVLDDLDGNGSIDASEAQLFYQPSPVGGSPFHWGLFQDFAGRWYLMDTTAEIIWRAEDLDGNGVIDNATEETLLWQGVASSLVWEVEVDSDGVLYVAESQDPDRILRMEDIDGNGSIDPLTEVSAVYDETTATVDIGNPRSLTIDRNRGGIAESFCIATQNSTGSEARIGATGSRSVVWEDLRLHAQPVPASQPGLFYYGAAQALVPFGNGFRCVGAGGVGLFRLPVVNSGPAGGLEWTVDYDAPPTPAGTITAGSTWFFQAWYRDPAGGGSFFNLSDGLTVVFLP